MEQTGTPKKQRKLPPPLSEEEYQAVKERYPNLDWNDEDQSYMTKRGTKSNAGMLRHLSPMSDEVRAMGTEAMKEKFRPQWDKFILFMSQGIRVSEAAKKAGLTYTAVRARYRSDPEFHQRWDEAEAQAAEPVEDSLYAAAINGNVPAAVKWLEKRSAERWPGDKVQIEQKNVYELDASDRIGNIIALMAQLQRRAELDAGAVVIDVESSEPEE